LGLGKPADQVPSTSEGLSFIVASDHPVVFGEWNPFVPDEPFVHRMILSYDYRVTNATKLIGRDIDAQAVL
jgi:hypothetical protein